MKNIRLNASQPSRILRVLLLFSVTLAPIYIGRIFTVSRPDTSIGSEISMPTYRVRLVPHASHVVVSAKVALTRSEIRLLIYLALIILYILLSETFRVSCHSGK